MVKVTKKQLIEALENNTDNKSDGQIAIELGITREWLCKLKKRYQQDLKQAAYELTNRIVLEQVNNLRRNAKAGSDRAAEILINMNKQIELEASIKEMQADIEKIKEIQAQQAEMQLVRKAS